MKLRKEQSVRNNGSKKGVPRWIVSVSLGARHGPRCIVFACLVVFGFVFVKQPPFRVAVVKKIEKQQESGVETKPNYFVVFLLRCDTLNWSGS